jgi:hypothetical protein
MSVMTRLGIFPGVPRHVRFPSRSARPAAPGRFHTTGQFLHRSELSQHILLGRNRFAIVAAPTPQARVPAGVA